MEEDLERSCLHQSRSGEVGTGYAFIAGRLQKLRFAIVDGQAIYQGDIRLGSVAEIAERTQWVAEYNLTGDASASLETWGSYLPGAKWHRPSFAFCLSQSFFCRDQVLRAVKHIRDLTGFELRDQPIACQLVPPHMLAVAFTAGDFCSSVVGMQFSPPVQTIELHPGCADFSGIVHELCHAIGLIHEHSRPDRDQFVTVHYENIEEDEYHNFDIDPGAATATPYDYGSIMHYERFDFTKNGLPTISPKDPSAVIGKAKGLSKRDVATIKSMYGL